jgi:hypothetical protein
MESLDVGPLPGRPARPLLTAALAALLVVSIGAGAPLRLEVIAPSTPPLESYFPLTLVARTEAGALDPGYAGDVWLWTDGPWIRPFHVRFTAADRGVIRVPVRVDLGGLTRIEAYELGGAVQAWSNPMRPIEANGEQPCLLWGTLGSDEPGLDFRLAPAESISADRPGPEGGQAGPALLPTVAVAYRSERWVLALNPALPATGIRELAAALAAVSDRKLVETVKAHEADLVLIRPGPGGPGSVKTVPYLLLADEARGGGPAPADALAVVAGEGGLIGVWSSGPDAAAIWSALRRGAAYASWRGRPLIDLSARAGGLHGLVAGEGPREVVSLSCPGGGAGLAWSTDADRLEFDRPGSAAGCALELREPGSPRASHALALTRAGMLPTD